MLTKCLVAPQTNVFRPSKIFVWGSIKCVCVTLCVRSGCDDVVKSWSDDYKRIACVVCGHTQCGEKTMAQFQITFGQFSKNVSNHVCTINAHFRGAFQGWSTRFGRRMRSVCNHHSKILQHHRIRIPHTHTHTHTHTTYAIRL